MNKMVNGENVEIPADEVAKIQLERDASIAEMASTKYKLDRKAESPSVEDQLDMIYWDKVNGTDSWKALIQTIKTKHPKP